MKKNICIVTGSRAEYGLLKKLGYHLQESHEFLLQWIVTGSHLSSAFDYTYRDILNDGFRINKKVEMLLSSDTSTAISTSVGLAMIGLGSAYSELRPDAIIILGDRYEILAAATAAVIAKIPIVHLHGGEVTKGAYDESFRHAITKMASLHFVATEGSRRRVLQMGERSGSVYTVGGLGVDASVDQVLLSRAQLETELDIKFRKINALVTYHPETLSEMHPKKQIDNLLQVLKAYPECLFIFTQSNSDSEGNIINQQISHFVSENENAKFFPSLGIVRYLSTMRICDAVIGNSSSGLLEAPTFKVGTVNIGDRQTGREKATSVVDVANNPIEINSALQTVLSKDFKKSLKRCVNPYGDGGASKRIIQILKTLDFPLSPIKDFNDLTIMEVEK